MRAGSCARSRRRPRAGRAWASIANAVQRCQEVQRRARRSYRVRPGPCRPETTPPCVSGARRRGPVHAAAPVPGWSSERTPAPRCCGDDAPTAAGTGCRRHRPRTPHGWEQRNHGPVVGARALRPGSGWRGPFAQAPGGAGPSPRLRVARALRPGSGGEPRQFLRGSSASSPSGNRPARRRITVRGNLEAVRPSRLSVAACQRSDPACAPRPPLDHLMSTQRTRTRR